MQIAVLGAGMVGRAIALDLADQFNVSAIDISTSNLNLLKQRNGNIDTIKADLADYRSYAALLNPFDIVVTAVPGFMGYQALQSVIESEKNVVDISFFPENALALDHLAKQKNISVITDCGVAPGMSNLILGRYNEEMIIDSFECYVGGLPKAKKPPFQYKAPFSPVDVIEEYTRPARLVEGGEIVTKPALSDREMIDFEKTGQLEAFNTDGLRSLIFTMKHIPEMKEKTLRYPGHVDLIIALQQAGFFDTKPLSIKGKMITPLDLTSQILISQWKLGESEAEFTVMKVVIKGQKDDIAKTIIYELYDEYDKKSNLSSMARTTGYTCSAAVNLLVKKLFSEKGVFPPEMVGKNKACFDFVIGYLKKRGVNWLSYEI